MNTMFVYFLMLKPALLAVLLLVGVPVAIGVWMLHHLRARKRTKVSAHSRLKNPRTATYNGFRP
jgi:hypothetical protein